MGDELHNRNKASNPLFQVALFPHLVQVGSADAVTRVAEFIEQAGHFILNSVMAGCKAMLDAGANVPESTIVTAIARNGVESIFEAMTSSIVSGFLKKALGLSSAHFRLETHMAESCSSVQPVSYL